MDIAFTVPDSGGPGGTGGKPSIFFALFSSPLGRLRFAGAFRVAGFLAGDFRADFLAAGFRAEVFFRALLFFAAAFLRVAGRLAAFRFGRDFFFAALFLRAGAFFLEVFFLAGAFLRAAFFFDFFPPFFAAIGCLRFKGSLYRDYPLTVKGSEPVSEPRRHVVVTC